MRRRRGAVRCIASLVSFLLDNDILCQSFESLSVWLDHRDGYITGFAGIGVRRDAGFADMHAADDPALRAVPEFVW
jgi:hypothetical protein